MIGWCYKLPVQNPTETLYYWTKLCTVKKIWRFPYELGYAEMSNLLYLLDFFSCKRSLLS